MDGVTRNFGDSLYEILLPSGTRYQWEMDAERFYFPGGNYICNEVILEVLAIGLRPVFSRSGWRGTELDKELVDQCVFQSVSGPHTKAELARHGIDVHMAGHVAYDIPLQYIKGDPNALAIVVRSIKDPSDYSQQSIHDLSADAMFSPVVDTETDIFELIKMISGARFVLAGSMTAAVVAHAYNIPFAPYDSNGYIDCLPKWYDWFDSVGLGEPIFCTNVIEGRLWHKNFVLGKK
jgi:hypothetical protein